MNTKYELTEFISQSIGLIAGTAVAVSFIVAYFIEWVKDKIKGQ